MLNEANEAIAKGNYLLAQIKIAKTEVLLADVQHWMTQAGVGRSEQSDEAE